MYVRTYIHVKGAQVELAQIGLTQVQTEKLQIFRNSC